MIRTSIRPMFALLALPICALAAAAGAQTAPVQFRVNNISDTLGVITQPPSMGIVYGGSGVGGNTTDALVFSWPNLTISHVAIPVCDRMCGDGFIPESFGGGGQSFPEKLSLRRFTLGGAGGLSPAALDPTDLIIAATTAEDIHGDFNTPALACCPINGGIRRENPFNLVWWDQWTWSTAAAPCGQQTCNNQPVASWDTGYADFVSPLPTLGSQAFNVPAICTAHLPSPGWSNTTSLVAWRDVRSSCRQILAARNNFYVYPPLGIVIRPSAANIDVDRPCVCTHGYANPTSGATASFVIAWREDNLSNFQSAVFARRVSIINNQTVLGSVVTVADFGQVTSNSAPAVSMFDDGSYAVQYVGFFNGDPPQEPLFVNIYDNQEPPVLQLGQIEIEPYFRSYTNHTIAARGPTWLHSATQPVKLSSVYELTGTSGTIDNLYGRALRVTLDSSSNVIANLGTRTRIPTNTSAEGNNRLAQPHQHPALLRSDGLTAVAWYRGTDNNVYCTIRKLPESCPADFNQDGVITVSDIFAFLAAWFGNCQQTGPAPCQFGSADFNTDGSINVPDIFGFLAAWFAGCS